MKYQPARYLILYDDPFSQDELILLATKTVDGSYLILDMAPNKTIFPPMRLGSQASGILEIVPADDYFQS